MTSSPRILFFEPATGTSGSGVDPSLSFKGAFGQSLCLDEDPRRLEP